METNAVERVFKAERGRILATLIRLLGDFDLAEDALAVALESALEQWPRDGVPDNPRAWLIRTARNKAIDSQRRERLGERKVDALYAESGPPTVAPLELDDETAVSDDRLRLIFTCCHPALAI